jgi:hypothetical protein
MSSVNPSETFPLLLDIAFVLNVAFSRNMASMSPSGWYPREREQCLVYSKPVRLDIQTNRFSLRIMIDIEIITHETSPTKQNIDESNFVELKVTF